MPAASKAFRVMRKMSHSVQDTAFLQSYLNDLKQAKEQQRNFMVEKYALMDNLIPNLVEDDRIDIIVDREAEWRDTMANMYPHIIGELQTLSPASLASYYDTVVTAFNQGRNLVQERYAYLMQLLGYASLDEREKQLADEG